LQAKLTDLTGKMGTQRPSTILSFGFSAKGKMAEDYGLTDGPIHLRRNMTERYRTQGLTTAIKGLDKEKPGRQLTGTVERARVWMLNEGGRSILIITLGRQLTDWRCL
jgi:hypothetical protein